jgi:DNA-binding MarR family transcriptional regulator
MPPESLHRRIAAALARIASLTRHHGHREAQSEGLSPLQARVLTTLQVRGEMRVGELASELLVAYGTLSEAVTSLDSKGLVAKTQDPEEHRAVRVALTRRGRSAAQRIEGWPDELLGPVVEALDERQAEVLLASLVRLLLVCERRGLIATGRMCVNCRFFVPEHGSGRRPHWCRLLEAPIGGGELQVDCPEFELADGERLLANGQRFQAPSSENTA